LPLAILGFEAADFGFYLTVNGFFAILNHSNVNINLGYLYYFVGTPKVSSASIYLLISI
jgi:hypothetical protein